MATAREPRLPPSVNIYGRYGDFVRSLKIPDKFVPDPTGQQTKGARGNAGFESLTLTPDGKRLFTAAETALVQDGELASLEAGTDTRVLELVARHETFEPSREFVYRLEPVQRPTFAPTFAFNGLVELLAIDDTTLLALERGFVASTERPGEGRCTIRLFSVTLSGATDVSVVLVPPWCARLRSVPPAPRAPPAERMSSRSPPIIAARVSQRSASRALRSHSVRAAVATGSSRVRSRSRARNFTSSSSAPRRDTSRR